MWLSILVPSFYSICVSVFVFIHTVSYPCWYSEQKRWWGVLHTKFMSIQRKLLQSSIKGCLYQVYVNRKKIVAKLHQRVFIVIFLKVVLIPVCIAEKCCEIFLYFCLFIAYFWILQILQSYIIDSNKLDGINYVNWKFKVQTLMEGLNLCKIVNGTEPEPCPKDQVVAKVAFEIISKGYNHSSHQRLR
jgi:hypothetical protein